MLLRGEYQLILNHIQRFVIDVANGYRGYTTMLNFIPLCTLETIVFETGKLECLNVDQICIVLVLGK